MRGRVIRAALLVVVTIAVGCGPGAVQLPTSLSHADDSGYAEAMALVPPIREPLSLENVRDLFTGLGDKGIAKVQAELKGNLSERQRAAALELEARYHLYEGRAKQADESLARARAIAEADADLHGAPLSQLMFLQGVASLRRAENENCVVNCGKGSCIVPIVSTAIHRQPDGARAARGFFLEYLGRHPEDRTARWLLNIACMTLGEWPAGVPEAWRIPESVFRSKVDIGHFQDIAATVGVDRMNLAGGAIMDDFDGDGLLDIVVSSMDRAQSMAFFRNTGKGGFEERPAGLEKALGGLYIVHADYDNDGDLDIFVPRGAWRTGPTRCSLLQNDGHARFTDVSIAAGVAHPMNSQAACWADYNNDGWVDLFVGGEAEMARLYKNKGDGTFVESAMEARLPIGGAMCKGANWGDFDRDGWPDLAVNFLDAAPRLYRNKGDGRFTDVAPAMGIERPTAGFSCFWLDTDNDGWDDLYLSGYDRNMEEAVRSLLGEPHRGITGRLYKNKQGKAFEDVTERAGLDTMILPMGSNFFDADNDGFLDLYFATKAPPYSTLLPNRMFKNMGGERFEDISYSSGTAHLQKGHAVTCGDWDRDGNVDLFVELGGATPGDRFRNALFQNPGHPGNWITLKLVGTKSNRAAIGARMRITTDAGLTVHRTVTSGSSFGANTFTPTIGLGKAARIRELEITWPTGRTTQLFRDLPTNQAFEITEQAAAPKPLAYQPIEH